MTDVISNSKVFFFSVCLFVFLFLVFCFVLVERKIITQCAGLPCVSERWEAQVLERAGSTLPNQSSVLLEFPWLSALFYRIAIIASGPTSQNFQEKESTYKAFRKVCVIKKKKKDVVII